MSQRRLFVLALFCVTLFFLSYIYISNLSNNSKSQFSTQKKYSIQVLNDTDINTWNLDKPLINSWVLYTWVSNDIKQVNTKVTLVNSPSKSSNTVKNDSTPFYTWISEIVEQKEFAISKSEVITKISNQKSENKVLWEWIVRKSLITWTQNLFEKIVFTQWTWVSLYSWETASWSSSWVQQQPVTIIASSAEDFQSQVEKIKEIQKSDDVVFVEPNYTYEMFDESPSDDRFVEQWWLKNNFNQWIDVNAINAWKLSTWKKQNWKKVVVAVIDAWVDIYHDDLKDNLWKPEWNVCKDWNNNLITWWCPNWWYDVINNDNNPYPDELEVHWTHVAWIIWASLNKSWIVWVAPDVQIMSLRACDGSTDSLGRCIFTTESIIKSIYFAANNWASVINASLGGSAYSFAMEEAITYARNKWVLFVAAAWNSSKNNDESPIYPANYDLDNIISVAAIDSKWNLAKFSHYWFKTVDIWAPWVDIISTVPTKKWSYKYLNGTSMATPHVAWVWALVFAANSWINFLNVKNRIIESAIPTPSLVGKTVTWKRLNAYNALIYWKSVNISSIWLFDMQNKPLSEVAENEYIKFVWTLDNEDENILRWIKYQINIKNNSWNVLFEKEMEWTNKHFLYSISNTWDLYFSISTLDSFWNKWVTKLVHFKVNQISQKTDKQLTWNKSEETNQTLTSNVQEISLSNSITSSWDLQKLDVTDQLSKLWVKNVKYISGWSLEGEFWILSTDDNSTHLINIEWEWSYLINSDSKNIDLSSSLTIPKPLKSIGKAVTNSWISTLWTVTNFMFRWYCKSSLFAFDRTSAAYWNSNKSLWFCNEERNSFSIWEFWWVLLQYEPCLDNSSSYETDIYATVFWKWNIELHNIKYTLKNSCTYWKNTVQLYLLNFYVDSAYWTPQYSKVTITDKKTWASSTVYWNNFSINTPNYDKSKPNILVSKEPNPYPLQLNSSNNWSDIVAGINFLITNSLVDNNLQDTLRKDFQLNKLNLISSLDYLNSKAWDKYTAWYTYKPVVQLISELTSNRSVLVYFWNWLFWTQWWWKTLIWYDSSSDEFLYIDWLDIRKRIKRSSLESKMVTFGNNYNSIVLREKSVDLSLSNLNIYSDKILLSDRLLVADFELYNKWYKSVDQSIPVTMYLCKSKICLDNEKLMWSKFWLDKAWAFKWYKYSLVKINLTDKQKEYIKTSGLASLNIVLEVNWSKEIVENDYSNNSVFITKPVQLKDQDLQIQTLTSNPSKVQVWTLANINYTIINDGLNWVGTFKTNFYLCSENNCNWWYKNYLFSSLINSLWSFSKSDLNAKYTFVSSNFEWIKSDSAAYLVWIADESNAILESDYENNNIYSSQINIWSLNPTITSLTYDKLEIGWKSSFSLMGYGLDNVSKIYIQDILPNWITINNTKPNELYIDNITIPSSIQENSLKQLTVTLESKNWSKFNDFFMFNFWSKYVNPSYSFISPEIYLSTESLGKDSKLIYRFNIKNNWWDNYNNSKADFMLCSDQYCQSQKIFLWSIDVGPIWSNKVLNKYIETDFMISSKRSSWLDTTEKIYAVVKLTQNWKLFYNTFISKNIYECSDNSTLSVDESQEMQQLSIFTKKDPLKDLPLIDNPSSNSYLWSYWNKIWALSEDQEGEIWQLSVWVVDDSKLKEDNLKSTEDVVIDEKIKQLAKSLWYDPVKIYEYVQKNIKYIPYKGARKTPSSCLEIKECNDIDTAALIISLFRASNIPARFAQWFVEYDADLMTKMLRVPNKKTAYKILKDFQWENLFISMKSDLYTKPKIEDSVEFFENIKSFKFTQIWGEAYLEESLTPINYFPQKDLTITQIITNYTNLKQRFSWRWIIPYYQKYEIVQKEFLAQKSNFDADKFYMDYLQGKYTSTPIDVIKWLLWTDISTSWNSLNINITDNTISVLPLSMPVLSSFRFWSFDLLPEDQKARFVLTIKNPSNWLIWVVNYYATQMNSPEWINIWYEWFSQSENSSFEKVWWINKYLMDTPIDIQKNIKVVPTIKYKWLKSNKIWVVNLTQPVKFETAFYVGNEKLYSYEKYSLAWVAESIFVYWWKINPSYSNKVAPWLDGLAWIARQYAIDSQNDAWEIASLFGHAVFYDIWRVFVWENWSIKSVSKDYLNFDWVSMDVISQVWDYSMFWDPMNNSNKVRKLYELNWSVLEQTTFERYSSINAISTIKAIQSAYRSKDNTVVNISLDNKEEVEKLQLTDKVKSKIRKDVMEWNNVIVPIKNVKVGEWEWPAYIAVNMKTWEWRYYIWYNLQNGGRSVDYVASTMVLALGNVKWCNFPKWIIEFSNKTNSCNPNSKNFVYTKSAYMRDKVFGLEWLIWYVSIDKYNSFVSQVKANPSICGLVWIPVNDPLNYKFWNLTHMMWPMSHWVKFYGEEYGQWKYNYFDSYDNITNKIYQQIDSNTPKYWTNYKPEWKYIYNFDIWTIFWYDYKELISNSDLSKLFYYNPQNYNTILVEKDISNYVWSNIDDKDLKKVYDYLIQYWYGYNCWNKECNLFFNKNTWKYSKYENNPTLLSLLWFPLEQQTSFDKVSYDIYSTQKFAGWIVYNDLWGFFGKNIYSILWDLWINYKVKEYWIPLDDPLTSDNQWKVWQYFKNWYKLIWEPSTWRVIEQKTISHKYDCDTSIFGWVENPVILWIIWVHWIIDSIWWSIWDILTILSDPIETYNGIKQLLNNLDKLSESVLSSIWDYKNELADGKLCNAKKFYIGGRALGNIVSVAWWAYWVWKVWVEFVNLLGTSLRKLAINTLDYAFVVNVFKKTWVDLSTATNSIYYNNALVLLANNSDSFFKEQLLVKGSFTHNKLKSLVNEYYYNLKNNPNKYMIDDLVQIDNLYKDFKQLLREFNNSNKQLKKLTNIDLKKNLYDEVVRKRSISNQINSKWFLDFQSQKSIDDLESYITNYYSNYMNKKLKHIKTSLWLSDDNIIWTVKDPESIIKKLDFDKITIWEIKDLVRFRIVVKDMNEIEKILKVFESFVWESNIMERKNKFLEIVKDFENIQSPIDPTKLKINEAVQYVIKDWDDIYEIQFKTESMHIFSEVEHAFIYKSFENLLDKEKVKNLNQIKLSVKWMQLYAIMKDIQKYLWH